jgi:hypothetical protein
MVLCEGLEIKVKNRMSLDNPDLYNLSSPLYNSICYHYSSKDGADMILDDRQNMYKDDVWYATQYAIFKKYIPKRLEN